VVTDALVAGGDLVRRGEVGALVLALDGPMRWNRALVDARGRIAAGHGVGVTPAELSSPVVSMMAKGESGVIEVGGVRLYVESLVPSPRLLLFGGGSVAEALCPMAALAGFVVEVSDPRSAFAAPQRFPDAGAVRCAWPEDVLSDTVLDERTYVVSLLHEARFEEALFPAVLDSPARYVGALGSRRTHAARVERLRGRGFDEEAIGRIHGPIGLDIGAVTPEEIAVSIIAEIVRIRRQGR
jgi:xanthine dehydrogenase accessory factor